MRVEIDSADESLPVILTQDSSGIPALRSISTIQRPLSIPGIRPAPTNNVRIECDNRDGRLTEIWAERPPIRKPARVVDGAVVFSGVVTGVTLGESVTIILEAGLDRPFSDTLPLRTSAVWGGWRDVRAIPWGWGRVTIEPIQYTGDQQVFVLLDHPIAGVDSVRRDNVETVAYAFSNQLDSTGQAVSFLELAEPLAEGEELSVTLRGRMDAKTGALIQSPAAVLYDVMTNLAGVPIEWPRFDEFRAETEGLKIGGVIDDDTATIRATIDAIVESVGGAWSTEMQDVAILWPPRPDHAAPALPVNPMTAQDLEGSTAAGDICTSLRVLFDWDDAGGRYKQAVQLVAPDRIKAVGELSKEWKAPWLRSPRDAENLGRRMLATMCRPQWATSWTMDLSDIDTGAWVDVDHKASPISGRHRLVSAELRTDQPQVTCEALVSVGQVPDIELVRLSAAYDPLIQPGINVEYGANAIIFTAIGEDGNPLPQARVTLDGQITRITDNFGKVSFEGVSAGRHKLLIEAAGHLPYEAEVIV